MKLNITEIKVMSGLLRSLAKEASEVATEESKAHAVFFTDTFQRIEAESRLGGRQLSYLTSVLSRIITQVEGVQSSIPSENTAAMHRAQALHTMYVALKRKVDYELQQRNESGVSTGDGVCNDASIHTGPDEIGKE